MSVELIQESSDSDHYDYERQGTSYDPHAVGYERVGRKKQR